MVKAGASPPNGLALSRQGPRTQMVQTRTHAPAALGRIQRLVRRSGPRQGAWCRDRADSAQQSGAGRGEGSSRDRRRVRRGSDCAPWSTREVLALQRRRSRFLRLEALAETWGARVGPGLHVRTRPA